MGAVLAAASHADVGLLFLLLALLAFAAAIYACYLGNWVAGIACAIVACIILVFAA